MKKMYDFFAKYYDALMSDVNYKKRAEYLLGLFCRFDKKPTLLLDLACGTGNISAEFAKNGVSVIGVDASDEMLSIAQNKAIELGIDILYLCQKAEDLDLYGTVDGAVCCLDSLNHITDYEKFTKAISNVSLFLEKDSLFIFDLNTVYKHKYILADNTFVFDKDNIYCVWQNSYSEDNKSTGITLDLFEKQNGKYTRFTEMFSERAYDREEVLNSLNKAGLIVEAVYGDMSEDPASDNAQRLIYVTRKL